MTDIQYKIVRSDRKSVVLVINSEAKVIVRAPFDFKESEIEKFIKKKRRWILEKQKKISALNTKINPVVFKNGESVPFLGSSYTFKVSSGSRMKISGENIIVPKGFKKEKVVAWMKREAKKLISERLDMYADNMGLSYSVFKLSGARTRWGSCSGRNNLNFTWRLIMCPVEVIDYVIVHELSHIRHKNHSPEFWALVKSVIPNFKEMKTWLKANRKLMDII